MITTRVALMLDNRMKDFSCAARQHVARKIPLVDGDLHSHKELPNPNFFSITISTNKAQTMGPLPQAVGLIIVLLISSSVASHNNHHVLPSAPATFDKSSNLRANGDSTSTSSSSPTPPLTNEEVKWKFHYLQRLYLDPDSYTVKGKPSDFFKSDDDDDDTEVELIVTDVDLDDNDDDDDNDNDDDQGEGGITFATHVEDSDVMRLIDKDFLADPRNNDTFYLLPDTDFTMAPFVGKSPEVQYEVVMEIFMRGIFKFTLINDTANSVKGFLFNSLVDGGDVQLRFTNIEPLMRRSKKPKKAFELEVFKIEAIEEQGSGSKSVNHSHSSSYTLPMKFSKSKFQPLLEYTLYESSVYSSCKGNRPEQQICSIMKDNPITTVVRNK